MAGERIAGVFEGGGAKGIAYAGALEELEAQGVSFGAVAGASAGAITAALIAAGCGAADLRDATAGALAAVALPTTMTKRLGLVKRLRDPQTPGLTETALLRDHIDATMRNRLGDRLGDGEAITFGRLFELTQIELFVVAVDTYLRQHVVFHHRITPTVAVADAVVASSSIPIVFGPMRAVRELDGVGPIANAVVDGGVWTNFPLFVFTDGDFRRYHELEPCPWPIVGFQLAEPRVGPAPGELTALTATVPEGATSSEELQRRGVAEIAAKRAKSQDEGRPGWLDEAMEAAEDPAGAEELDNPSTISSLPLARGRFGRLVQGMVEQSLMGLHGWAGTIIAAAAAVFGPVLFLLVVGQWMLEEGDGWFSWFALGTVFLSILAIAVGLMVLTLVSVLGNAVFLHPVRRVGYPMLLTYTAASGVPYWLLGREGHPSDVIALPIRPEVGTLSFVLTPEVIASQMADARAATAERLPKILAGKAGPTAAELAPDKAS